MDLETLTRFFMITTIINCSIYLLFVLFLVFAPDFVYRVQSRWFPIPRDTFNVVSYCFLGVFKTFFIFFNVTPYVALLILGH